MGKITCSSIRRGKSMNFQLEDLVNVFPIVILHTSACTLCYMVCSSILVLPKCVSIQVCMYTYIWCDNSIRVRWYMWPGLQKSTMSVHENRQVFSTLLCHNSCFGYANKPKFTSQLQKFMENFLKLTEWKYLV